MQESTRASSVVSRVRALFRKEAQVRESTDMNRLIQDLARLLRDEAIRSEMYPSGLTWPRSSPAEDGPVQIQQVLLNLAMNAMDAMDACGPPARDHHPLKQTRRRRSSGNGGRSRAGHCCLKLRRGSLSRSSAPSRREREWDWPSAAALSKHTTAVCGRKTPREAAPYFNSPCGRSHDGKDRHDKSKRRRPSSSSMTMPLSAKGSAICLKQSESAPNAIRLRKDFCDSWTDSNAGCLLLDARLPGMSGVEFQEQMQKLGIGIP